MIAAFILAIALNITQQIEMIIDDFFYSVRLTQNYEARRAEAKSYIPIILEQSEKYGLDPILVAVMIREESGFNKNAIGAKGEVGLMQIMPQYVHGFDLSNPVDQIAAGCEHLAAARLVCGPELMRRLSWYASGSCNKKGDWLKNRISRYYWTKRKVSYGSEKGKR